jgi:hypothetical protein
MCRSDNRKVLNAAVAYRVMPHPRLNQNKRALRIPRGLITDKSVLRTLEYLSNRDALAWLLKDARIKAGAHPMPPKTLLRAKISIWRVGSGYPDADADNLAKTVLDALKEAGWIEDDRWVRSPHIDVFDGAARDMVAVRIEERTQADMYG